MFVAKTAAQRGFSAGLGAPALRLRALHVSASLNAGPPPFEPETANPDWGMFYFFVCFACLLACE